MIRIACFGGRVNLGGKEMLMVRKRQELQVVSPTFWVAWGPDWEEEVLVPLSCVFSHPARSVLFAFVLLPVRVEGEALGGQSRRHEHGLGPCRMFSGRLALCLPGKKR